MVCASLLGVLMSAGAVGQTVDNRAARRDVSDLTDRAATFADGFFRDFASVVAEERYDQQLLGTGIGPRRTVLVSDFLLVDVPGQGWMPFRDVFERDGQQIRDRQNRLVDLFLTQGRQGLEQAQAISSESARYNIGSVQRTVNVPTLALAFLLAEHRWRFAFKLDGRNDNVAVVSFEEKIRPTVVHDIRGGDVPMRGRFWFDERAQAVVRTEVRAIDATTEAMIGVTYERNAALNLWVPARMEERYRRDGSRNSMLGEATYSKFRRFQVTTTQELGQ